MATVKRKKPKPLSSGQATGLIWAVIGLSVTVVVLLMALFLARSGEPANYPIAEGGVLLQETLSPVQPTSSPEPLTANQSKRIVIVIDDVGYNRRALDRFIGLGLPLTFAVLPGLAQTGASGSAIRQSGNELILHQPLEPYGSDDPGPGLVKISMPAPDMTLTFNQNLTALPGLVGANNHMGSKGTQESEVLRPLFVELKRRGLFFLDSKTSAHTKVKALGAEIGLPILERDIFLDNVRTVVEIRKSLAQGLAVADRRGYAIMIGHVWSPELAEVLQADGPSIVSRGYTFSHLQDLVISQTNIKDHS